MRRMNPRQARRMMQQMGMKVEPLPNVAQVIIKMEGREVVIDGPEVSLMQIQGQNIYQVMGGTASERATEIKVVPLSHEDVQLVAQQANVTIDAARRALEETKGDLAQAILLLAQRRTM